MSFWSVIGKVGKFAVDTSVVVAEEMNKKANKIKQIHEKYLQLSDGELIKIAKSDGAFGNSSQEREIAVKVLKKRGINREDF